MIDTLTTQACVDPNRVHATGGRMESAFGGHTWPGSPKESPGKGTTTREISANALMWRFFAAHPRQ